MLRSDACVEISSQEFDSAQKNPVNEGSTAELGNFRSQQRKETGTSVENQESLGNEGASLSYQQAQDPSTTYAIYTESAQRQSANHAPHATSQEQYTPRTTETYSARFHPTDSYRQAAPNIYGEAYQGLYEYQQAQNIQYQQRHSINAHRATYSHASHYRAGSPRAYYDKQPHRMARAQYPSCRYENDQVWYVSHSGYSQAKDEPYAYKPVQKREDGHVMGEVIEDESRLLPAPEHMKKSVKNDYKAFGDHKGSRRTRRLWLKGQKKTEPSSMPSSTRSSVAGKLDWHQDRINCWAALHPWFLLSNVNKLLHGGAGSLHLSSELDSWS